MTASDRDPASPCVDRTSGAASTWGCGTGPQRKRDPRAAILARSASNYTDCPLWRDTYTGRQDLRATGSLSFVRLSMYEDSLATMGRTKAIDAAWPGSGCEIRPQRLHRTDLDARLVGASGSAGPSPRARLSWKRLAKDLLQRGTLPALPHNRAPLAAGFERHARTNRHSTCCGSFARARRNTS